MQISPRDKKLLKYSFLFILIALYLRFFLIPQTQSIHALKAKILTASEKYQLNQIYRQRITNLAQEKEQLRQKITAVRQSYPPQLSNSDVIAIIYAAAAESGLKIINLNLLDYIGTADMNSNLQVSGNQNSVIQNTAPAAPAPVNVTDAHMQALIQELGLAGAGTLMPANHAFGNLKITDGQGYLLKVKLIAEGNDRQLKAFFAKIANLPNQVVVKEYSLMLKDDRTLSADANLDFYGIADAYADHSRLLDESQFTALTPAAQVNLFAGQSALSLSLPNADHPSSLAGSQQDLLKDYDFSMRVVPYGNDLAPATISLAVRGLLDHSKSALIFGNQPGREEVELVIEEKDQRFYCKYRTQTEAFPDKKYLQTIEFKPAGAALKMIIDATPRKFAADKSSVYLMINNNSTRRFMLSIFNDDPQNPRIKVKAVNGKLDVLRNAD